MHRIYAYVELGLLFCLAISLLYLPFGFYFRRRGFHPVRQLAWLGLGCSGFLICFAAFWFMPIRFGLGNHFSCNLIPLHFLTEINSTRLLITEKIPNIMLFMPLGFFLPGVFPHFRSLGQTALLALGLTCFIEFVQFFIGRSADIDDVICNFLGGIIGFGIYKLFDKALGQTAFWQRFLGQAK